MTLGPIDVYMVAGDLGGAPELGAPRDNAAGAREPNQQCLVPAPPDQLCNLSSLERPHLPTTEELRT